MFNNLGSIKESTLPWQLFSITLSIFLIYLLFLCYVRMHKGLFTESPWYGTLYSDIKPFCILSFPCVMFSYYTRGSFTESTCYGALYGDIKHSVLCLSIRTLHCSGYWFEEDQQGDIMDCRRPYIVVSKAAVDPPVFCTGVVEL